MLLALVTGVLHGCVVDGVDPSYGTLVDVVEETTSAVGRDGIQEYRVIDCLAEPGQREVMSIRFPDTGDTDVALESIWVAWSSMWPRGAAQESDQRITVTTPEGVAAATVLDDPEGEFRVDFVGPCRET